MKYDRHYRSAMERITATDQWKADTLAKMADARRSRFRLSPKRAAAGLAACLAVAAVLGSLFVGLMAQRFRACRTTRPPCPGPRWPAPGRCSTPPT